jgi:hypothetical protein
MDLEIDAYSCQTFDGENQGLIDARSTYPHDWASMAVYDDKMWVVGGCDPTGFSCGNTVEFYNGESWQIGTNHPHADIYGNLVLADADGLYERVVNLKKYDQVKIFQTWKRPFHLMMTGLAKAKYINSTAFLGFFSASCRRPTVNLGT